MAFHSHLVDSTDDLSMKIRMAGISLDLRVQYGDAETEGMDLHERKRYYSRSYPLMEGTEHGHGWDRSAARVTPVRRSSRDQVATAVPGGWLSKEDHQESIRKQRLIRGSQEPAAGNQEPASP